MVTERRDPVYWLTNRVCLYAANLLPLLVIQLTLREIFAGNYHVIQVPAKETRQEEQRRIRGNNKIAKIYYTRRVHREIPSQDNTSL